MVSRFWAFLGRAKTSREEEEVEEEEKEEEEKESQEMYGILVFNLDVWISMILYGFVWMAMGLYGY